MLLIDEKLENKLDEFLNVIYRNNLDFNHPELVLNKLLEIYEKNKYPGVLYRIGHLYEFGFFKKLKEDKTIHYYELAANEGYIPAMNALGRLGLQSFMTYKFKFANWARESAIENDDSEGKYLLAKYCMISGLLDNDYLFKNGMNLMKESAKEGYSKAIDFIKENNWRFL